jgi:acyl carrier protein
MTDLTTTFDRVHAIVVRELTIEPDFVKRESHLVDDLGADSFGSICIAQAIEEEFGVEVSTPEIKTMHTVADIVDLVAGKLT